MENHPIPQDITGFQFKLIGDMTIKQFAYLATGVIVAWLFFSLPIYFLIRFPLAAVVFLSGMGLAFVPVGGRPLDAMIIHFFKAMFAPNQYVFQKAGGMLQLPSLPKEALVVRQQAAHSPLQLQAYLQQIAPKPKNETDQKELLFLQSLPFLAPGSGFPSLIPVMPTPQHADDKKEEVEKKKIELEINIKVKKDEAAEPKQTEKTKEEKPQKADQKIEISAAIAPKPPSQNPVQEKPVADQKPTPQTPVSPLLENQDIIEAETKLEKAKELLDEQLEQLKKEDDKQDEKQNTEVQETKLQAKPQEKEQDYEEQYKQILAQKQRLEKALEELHQKLEEQKKIYVPSTAQVKQETKNVRKIPKEMTVKVGFPHMPEAPNIICGIVHDSRGNVLNNILIEIIDKDGNPMRAFKTNSLGHFASATPLSNGVYTLDFEDSFGKHTFTPVEITVSGDILAPLEVISIDEREELRRELFGK